MEEIKKQIIALMNKSADKVHSAGSCGELGDSFQALDADCFSDVANEIYENHIKNLQHYRDEKFALWHTDKEPNKLFETVMNTIDGDKCMSAIDYEYYKKIFDRELQKLMFTL